MDFLPFYTLIAIILVILWLYREDRKEFRKERQDLLNRIMSKSLEEYQSTIPTPEDDKKEEEPETVIPIEDARDDIYGDNS